jgi:hypothetical protein
MTIRENHHHHFFTLIPSGVGTTLFHHVVIKIRQLILHLYLSHTSKPYITKRGLKLVL